MENLSINEIRVPPDITPLNLPPHSPELNAIERVWQNLRDRYLSGRLFTGIAGIIHTSLRGTEPPPPRG